MARSCACLGRAQRPRVSVDAVMQETFVVLRRAPALWAMRDGFSSVRDAWRLGVYTP